MTRIIRGNAWVFGDHVDTDVIIPARYLTTHDPVELGRHCMEDASPNFPGEVKRGDIIVAGENFGCGSSREHAPLAIMGCGISCVIAASFARIFYRNAINLGLPILEIPDPLEFTSQGDLLSVNLDHGRVSNLTKGTERKFPPIRGMAEKIVSAGGLVNYVKGIIVHGTSRR
ncbi:3-isopropylmalate dehydratase, small subunit [Thermanaerovibrio velox DSM 12556]|uniref:3-isopropylmalate dehydratase small subunit n=1 Tax=Thermanaerovibrio velox DSM 12556 TaxID=926567 RepID=H0UNG0_9BACT|nr:3-isopropylmalate dehydratase small subunit [Thermanaerovibrio velox]EHM09367.1 3-isopropylmalate dehydratase, small subunit [Thermanaerovibrio velox DSM 12556]